MAMAVWGLSGNRLGLAPGRTRRRSITAGRFLVAFGLRFTAIAAAAFLVAMVLLTALSLANLDILFAGLLGVEDAILIPVQGNSGLVN